MPRTPLTMPPERHPLQPIPGSAAAAAYHATMYEPSGQTVEEVERELVLRTLASHRGNRTTAARALGISVRTLRNKIRAYHALGIAVPAPLSARFARN